MTSECTTREAAENATKEGVAFFKRDDYERALISFRCAAAAFGQLGDHAQQADALSMTGGILAQIGREEGALSAFFRVIELFGEGVASLPQAMAWSRCGMILARQKKFHGALDCFGKSLALFEQIGDQLTNIAYAHLVQQAPADALWWYREGLTCYTASGNESKIRSIRQNLDTLEAALDVNRRCNC